MDKGFTDATHEDKIMTNHMAQKVHVFETPDVLIVKLTIIENLASGAASEVASRGSMTGQSKTVSCHWRGLSI